MKSEERYRVDLEQISGFCYWRAPLTPGRTLGACFMFFKSSDAQDIAVSNTHKFLINERKELELF